MTLALAIPETGMVTLRCTAKLLKHLRATPHPDPPPSTTRLGDWYANRIQMGRTPLILAVSERSLLPVLLPARQVAQLPILLPDAVEEILSFLQIPEPAVREEIAAMQEGVTVSRTASRVVLGVMNDFARMIEHHLRAGDSLQHINRHFTTTLFSPLKMRSPDRATRELLS
jgi:hypothetical protein